MAAWCFNSTYISGLIAEGTKLDHQDENGNTPLHYAVKSGSQTLVDSLLKHGINVDSRNKDDNTPLHEAIMKNSLPLVKQLLLAGCDVNLQGLFGFTPLHLAISNNLDCITETLLDASADVNLKDFKGRTSLHLAVDINSRSSIIGKILHKEININETDHSGRTLIFLAVRHKSNELVTNMLLEKGFKANIQDSKGTTPLHFVNKYTQKGTVELLLDHGLEIDKKDENGRTPLFHAIKCNNNPVADLLLNRGSDVNLQDNAGKSPLHFASVGHKLGLVQRLLLEKTIYIDKKDKHGQTALVQVVRDNNTAVLHLLLLKGSNINVRDSKGNNPFHIATKYSHLKSLKRLLSEKNYDINEKDVYGNTPLHLAANNNNEDIINLLLKKGASLNVQNVLDRTPLHVAVHYGYINSVKLLLEAGARLDFIDKMGKTPLDLSVQIYNPLLWKDSITNLLKEHIVKIRSANLEFGLNMQNYDFTGYELFTESCLVEVEKIKTKMFGGVSMFRVFSNSESQNPVLAGNLEMENFINSRYLKTEFPIYSTLLKLKFSEIEERHSLLCSIVFNIRVYEGDFFREIFLPNELKRKILCYLTNKELENLKKVCH